MRSSVIPDKAHTGVELIASCIDLERRVYDATEGTITEDARNELIAIRDYAINAQTNVSAFVGAFSDILRINGIDLGGEGKEEFDSRVKAWEKWRKKERERERKEEEERKRNKSQDKDQSTNQSRRRWWPSHVQRLLFIKMRWSPEVLLYYKWDVDNLGRDIMTCLYKCAKKYPRFKIDFVPQANLVRWLKHRSAVPKMNDAKTKSINFAGFAGEFSKKDLEWLEQLDKDQPVEFYGASSTLATSGRRQRDMEEWTLNQDGHVKIDGQSIDLKERRPDHWRMYLLEFDRHGMLRQRNSQARAETPFQTGILSPPKSAPRLPIDDDDTHAPEAGHAVVGLRRGTETPSVTASWDVAYHHTDRNGSVDGSASDIFGSDVSTLVPTSAVSDGYKFHDHMVVAAKVANRLSTDDVAILEEAPREDDQGVNRHQPATVQIGEVDDSSSRSTSPQSQISDKVRDSEPYKVADRRQMVRPRVRHPKPANDDRSNEDKVSEVRVNEDSIDGIEADESEVDKDAANASEVDENRSDDEDEDEDEGEDQDEDQYEDGDELNNGRHEDRVDEYSYDSEDSGDVEQTRASSAQGLFVPTGSLSLGPWRENTFEPPPCLSVSSSRSCTPEYSGRSNGSSIDRSSKTHYTKTPSTSIQKPHANSRYTAYDDLRPKVHDIWGGPPGHEATNNSMCRPNLLNQPAIEELMEWQGRTMKHPSTLDGVFHTPGMPEISEISKILETLQVPDMSKTLQMPDVSDMLRMPGVSEMLRMLDVSEVLQIPDVSEMLEMFRLSEMPKVINAVEMLDTNRRNSLGPPTPLNNSLSGDNQNSLSLVPIHTGPCPELCSCHTCNDLKPVLENNRLEASLPDASPRCLSRSALFGDALWALAVDASHAVQKHEQEKAEVLCFDETTFARMLEEGVPLTKPIIVRSQGCSAVTNVKEVREKLLDSYGVEFKVKATKVHSCEEETIRLDDFLATFSGNEQPVASFVPQSLLGGPPAFMFRERFRLLHSAMHRSTVHASETRGGLHCGRIAHSVHDLSLARVEATGAFCGPRIGIFGGTWVDNLMGRRLCAFIPPSKMTPSMWNDFAGDALTWRPGDERRLILLQPNDKLLLPPGTVYAQMPVDASASLEGSFWDGLELQRYLGATLRAQQLPTDIPSCVRHHAIDGLMSMARSTPDQGASARFDGVRALLENEYTGDIRTAESAGCVESTWLLSPNLQAVDSARCRRTGSPLELEIEKAGRGGKRKLPAFAR